MAYILVVEDDHLSLVAEEALNTGLGRAAARLVAGADVGGADAILARRALSTLLDVCDRHGDGVVILQAAGPLEQLVEMLGDIVITIVDGRSPQLATGAGDQALFVVSAETDRAAQVSRLGRMLFGEGRETPTRAEYAMFAAYGAALRSAAFRGGVGAAVVDEVGEVIALGAAEVPAFGGGHYWCGDPHDARDWLLGYDPATQVRHLTVQALLGATHGLGLGPPPTDETVGKVLAEFQHREGAVGVGLGTQAAQTFESLGRVVHAEMSAVLTCARNGVATAGRRLYVTSSPCRQCLRHVVAAGMSELVYIGVPFKAPPEFLADSVTTDPTVPGRLLVRAFEGVTPGLYARLFTRGLSKPSVREIQLRLRGLESA
jgi:deoxycytidylate deaminase